jgi:drug/metabolite transporter (DMT)-like permease
MNTPRINIALFFLLACLWSGSFIGIKIVVATWPPIFGAAVRVGIALISFMILLIVMHKKTYVPSSLRWKLWVIGMFAQAIPFIFLFWGERFVSPGLAGILNGTVPIWTFAFALLFMPKSADFSVIKTLGLLVGLLGITIVFWPLLTFEYSLNLILGAAAILVMAMSYAIGGLLNQLLFKRSAKLDFFTNIYHQHCGSLTFLILASLVFEKWPSIQYLGADYRPWLACLYLGVCATALAFAIFYYLIREWDAVRATSVLYVVPVLALLWDYIFFNDPPQSAEMLGVAAILVGVVLIQLSTLRRNLSRQ